MSEFSQQELPKRSTPWILFQLLFNTILGGVFIGGLLAIGVFLISRNLDLMLNFWFRTVVMLFGAIGGLWAGKHYVVKKAKIYRKELKKIILYYVFIPVGLQVMGWVVLSIFGGTTLIEMVGGVREVFLSLLTAFIYWGILGLLCYRWLSEKAE